MGLSAQNVAIVPTPSGVLDGHFPDGNDGTGAIPLTWATVPSFLQKQVGTPFNVNVFTLYLTQPGAPAATATVSVGSLASGTSGWTLSSAGLLAYDGVGQGTGTIRVRATRLGFTSDSNLFSFESIATIVSADTLAPTIPTNPAMVSKTAVQVVVNCDVPSDVPTATIPSSGFKEVRWFKEGVIDGVTSYATGLNLRLTKLDVATGGAGRKLRLGHYVALQEGDIVGGIPNATTVADAGPIAAGTQALLCRYRWKVVETSQNTYSLANIRRDLKACGASAAQGGAGVYLFAIIVVRTFDVCPYGIFTASVAGATSGTLTSAMTNGTYGFVFFNNHQTGATSDPGTTDVNNSVDARLVTVSGGVNVTWSTPLVSTAFTTVSANPISNNPLPTYLQDRALPFTNGSGNFNGGWQTRRWDASAGGVTSRWAAMMTAISNADAQDPAYPGVTIGNHPNMGGIGTQETANSVVNAAFDGYTQGAYTTGLKAESDAISSAFPNCRHLFLMNFMNGNTVTGTSELMKVAGYIAQNGAILAGPDLVMAGAIVSPRCYPIYQAYHDGTATADQASAGFTGCSIQNAEWTGIGPADGPETMETIFQWGNGQIAQSKDSPPKANPFINHPLDIYIWDWHHGTNSLGESFTSAIGLSTGSGGIMSNHPPPFGTLRVPTGMATGSVTQTGTDYSVLSFGTGVSATADQWTGASGSVNGNVTVICKFNGLTGVDLSQGTAMGVRISDASGPSARAVYMLATSTQLFSRYRVSAGATPTTLVLTNAQGYNVVKWVKITRVGDLFSFFYSLDGLTWTAVGSTTLAMVPTVYIQLFGATTGTTSVTASFQQINIQQLSKINYTFVGLTTATTYHFTAVGRDLANNDSAASPILTVTTS